MKKKSTQKKKLTQRTVAELVKNEIPAKGSRIIYDETIPGFGLRLTAGGVASFVLNYYRKSDGQERRMTIGRWSELAESADSARRKALELRQQVHDGVDPIEAKKTEVLVSAHSGRTLGDLAKDYLANYAPFHKRPACVRDDRNMLQSVVLPRLGPMPLSAISTSDIEALHNSLQATPYRANRILSLLSKMFNIAIAADAEAAEKYSGEEAVRWITINPTKRVERFPERKRKKWLDVEQLEALKTALDEYPSQDVANIIRLQLLTGSRIGEVLSAEWADFDLKKGLWNKPAHKTKQDEDEELELSDRALTLVKQMAAHKNGSPYLFPGSAPERRRSHRGYIKWAWMQICKSAGLAEKYMVPGKKRELSRWRPLYRTHDLRHTFASHLASSGESLMTIGKLVGHRNTKTTERYAHLATNTQKKAADHFAQIIGW
jgi:integrase